MRLDSERPSDNVEDRRGFSVGRGAVGGGAILLAIVAALLGAPSSAVRDILRGGSPAPSSQSQGSRPAGPPDEQTMFVRKVLGSTEDTWQEIFAARGSHYQPPKLTLFSEA